MTAASFVKTGTPIEFDKGLGLCFGWFCFSKKDGVDYVDAHGDHFPDDELVKAVDGLMAKPASERAINVEHSGPSRGSIATAQALTEDVAKKLGIDTAGTYGVIGSFRPDDALLKSIKAGDAFCLSIEGRAHDVEVVSKSADGTEIEAGKAKRIMRKVELTKLAVVKAGAHEGAAVALIKSAAAVVRTRIAKRAPGLTSLERGHQHVIYDIEEPDGRTSYETAEGAEDGYGHSHVFVQLPDGSIAIGAAAGHTHTLITEATETEPMTDVAATALTKTRALLAVAVALTPEQASYAKGLAADKLEAFLAMTGDERAKVATPIHKSADGTCYFATDDRRMVELAKANDANAVELAKAREVAAAVAFEKRAEADLPALKGTAAERALLLKAIDLLPEADRPKALEILKAASLAQATIFKAPGRNDRVEVTAGPQAELDALTAEIQKSKPGLSFAKASAEAMETPRGRELYQAIDQARRAQA